MSTRPSAPSPRARATRLLAAALGSLASLAALGAAACGGDDEPAPPQTFTLTVTNTGTGSGRVLSAPAGIDCQITNGAAAATGCTATFTTGTAVGLIATPATAAQEFAGWGLPCADAAVCNLTVTGNTTVSAGFRARVQTLTLTLQAPANRDDGAMMLTLAGPTILAIRPGAGLELSEVRDAVGAAGTARSRMLLRGTLASGALLQVDVPGSAAPNQYQALVQQVAARASGSYVQRTDLAAYQLTLR
jgi:hypothetical protein